LRSGCPSNVLGSEIVWTRAIERQIYRRADANNLAGKSGEIGLTISKGRSREFHLAGDVEEFDGGEKTILWNSLIHSQV